MSKKKDDKMEKPHNIGYVKYTKNRCCLLGGPKDGLIRYIPKRLRSHVTDAFHDSDGYWVWFDDAVDTKYDPFMPCGTIHEDTILEVRARLSHCVVVS